MSLLDSLNRFLNDNSKREVKRLWPVVRQIRELVDQPDLRGLTLADLPSRTAELRQLVAAGETLDEILPRTFALVVRACQLLQGTEITIGKQSLTWNMVPFDVQLIGGMVLHRGAIAEMRTGEGKTLVCTLPVILNALAGKGVHVVTVNDYLAKRDAQWMGVLYRALGLSVGTIVHGLTTEERRAAYASDITYGTNNEFGFDYLRDSMAPSLKQQVQRSLSYAIVDEVDSILIDEARTPLIISAPAEESTTKYQQYAQLVVDLKRDTHFTVDEKQRSAILTEAGIAALEVKLGVENIYTSHGFSEVHHIEQALKAHAIFQRDVDYVVKDGEIIIVDEFTGRLMPGRRYSHGLHQAIEAKEAVEVQRESRTLATITFQNYFRLYGKLAGMTGTAKTEEEEFESIYKLRTIVIPTHRVVSRIDQPDAVYRTVSDKFKAVVREVAARHAKGQPVLVGTTSIEKSEVLSKLLGQAGVPHQVLNAKQHEKEADIVAQAGQRGAVTIATNMAGRGTDIKLGEGVAELGGLTILGTERHEARRIDNQLRGRSGRQGDPGESLFFVSMEDDLMRLFGGDRLKSMMERLKVPDDVPLQNGVVSRSIESAQKRVEGHNFDLRRHVLQYDDVMNKHRTIIYARRHAILKRIAEAEEGQQAGADVLALHGDVVKAIEREARALAASHTLERDPASWPLENLQRTVAALHPEAAATLDMEALRRTEDANRVTEAVVTALVAAYERACAETDPVLVARAERIVTLRAIDTHWMDHIDDMSHLREQVAFSGYAQRDPLVEYQDQGFRRFQQLLATIDATIVRVLLQVDFQQFAAPVRMAQPAEDAPAYVTNEAQIEAELEQTGVAQSVRQARPPTQPSPVARRAPLPHERRGAAPQPPRPSGAPAASAGRNDPCPCGSGKKFKKCHGAEA
jgi:preprotein translocase subunit SecA